MFKSRYVCGRFLFATVLAALAVTGNAHARDRLFPRLRAAPFRQELPYLPALQLPAAPSRNMVNLVERNLPIDWSVEEGKLKNIKWSASLGKSSFGMPVVASGKVFTASSNRRPDQAVLSAFREADGKLLWQNTHNHPPEFDAGQIRGSPSSPTVDGDSVYYITPASEIICAASDTGKILWRFDLAKELKVYASDGGVCTTPPHGAPLVFGDLVFVITGNGTVDGTLVSPKAPSFVALHKKTGKLAWQSNLPGENVIEGQWSSPTCAVVNGVPQVIFAGGDSVIYSFEPETGKLLWKCDCLPTRVKKESGRIDNYFLGAPVVVGSRLYVGMGVTSFHRPASWWSYFLCLDITKSGDVSFKSYDNKAPENKNSALVWAFGGPIEPALAKGQKAYFGSTMSTAAVQDGLVYISEHNGYLHCLDANTGQRYWEHDVKASVWGSPYLADGKVYLASEDEVHILAQGKTGKLIATMEMDAVSQTTPIAANGVLFVATRFKVYAIGAR